MGADGRDASIDDGDDPAAAAASRGHGNAATPSAQWMFAVDEHDMDAEDLLAFPAQAGEIRRLTILFADLVDSTVLSTRVEPERYRTLVGRYRDQVLRIVDRYEGHIDSTKGDGLLAVFGHPKAHEDDARRAVLAGLAIVREVKFRLGASGPLLTFKMSPPRDENLATLSLDTLPASLFAVDEVRLEADVGDIVGRDDFRRLQEQATALRRKKAAR